MSWLLADPSNEETPSSTSGRGSRSASLSEGLLRLEAEPLREQARWWTELARRLEPRRLQPGSLEVDFDTLGRFFDGTTLAMNFIISRIAGEKDELSVEDLKRLFLGHFGLLGSTPPQDVLRDEGFLKLCGAVLDGEQLPLSDRRATRESVLYASRRLRLGALLAARGPLQDMLYHYSYSRESIRGSFVASTKTSARFGQNGWHRVAVVEPQMTCEECGSVAEYTFSEPHEWEGRIHWVHAHRPETRSLLVLGQQHQLGRHIQSVLCRLQGASAQLDIAEKQMLSDAPSSLRGSPCWSCLVFPTFHMDEAAGRSLERYRAWSQKAKTGKAAPGNHVPPCVSVGVVHQNLAILWAGVEDKTVISVSTAATYLGRWSSAEPHLSKPLESLLSHCRCCCRRWKGDGGGGVGGYEPLPQEDDEEDPEASSGESREEELLADTVARGEELLADTVERAISRFEGSADAELSATFEITFRDILAQLGEENSMLRMGTHVQLAFRAVLNGTSQCLNVMALYRAAIHRISCLLCEKEQPRKEDLIAKISTAKFELSTLIRMVEPFAEYVVPQLRSEVLPTCGGSAHDALPVLAARQHMVDIENNLREFLRECRSQEHLCESLIKEYDMKASDKVNNILNFLTIITFLVMPMQILTGLYGMNFKRMPELSWDYGYHFFFGMALTGTAVFAMLLACVYRLVV